MVTCRPPRVLTCTKLPWTRTKTEDVIEQTGQVERYRLSAGNKWIELERRLMVKRQPWKILGRNYQIDVVSEGTVRDMHELFNRIIEVRTGKTRITYRLPSERNPGS